jgi:hypothetical protein
MLKKLTGNIKRAKNWHSTYKKQIKLASNITIKNKQLALELEQACNENEGILTYAEFLNIDQFGNNGFYATSPFHGKTDVEKRWGGALANYCLRLGHDTIIEVGCGTGELGVATAKAYKSKTNKNLNWIGVEIDKNLHPKIFQNFKTQNLQECVKHLAVTLDELLVQKNPLIIFPYCLDNIPPNIFLNTKSYAHYPNALLGITIKNRILNETNIPQEILQKKGIRLENGIFTENKLSTKLTSWKLRKGQRAYVSTDAFITLYQYAKKFKDSTTIIIDEFRKEPFNLNLDNLATPKSLYEKNLEAFDRIRYYRESGQHNLYYPIYRDTLLKFLTAIGYGSIEYDVEQKIAAELRGKRWFPVAKYYTTFAYIAKDLADKHTGVLPITFNPQRII